MNVIPKCVCQALANDGTLNRQNCVVFELEVFVKLRNFLISGSIAVC